MDKRHAQRTLPGGCGRSSCITHPSVGGCFLSRPGGSSHPRAASLADVWERTPGPARPAFGPDRACLRVTTEGEAHGHDPRD